MLVVESSDWVPSRRNVRSTGVLSGRDGWVPSEKDLAFEVGTDGWVPSDRTVAFEFSAERSNDWVPSKNIKMLGNSYNGYPVKVATKECVGEGCGRQLGTQQTCNCGCCCYALVICDWVPSEKCAARVLGYEMTGHPPASLRSIDCDWVPRLR